MFKKINQTLITKYPLIWNLKFIWILLTILVFNLIAFINGFLFFTKKSQLQESGLYEVFFNSGIIIYYVLIGVIICVIWLYFYIKNNRFKSNYPTSRNYLFKEFLAVFFIIFLMFYVPNSFKTGLKFRVSNYMSEEQYLKDIDIINRTQGFTLRSEFGYDNYSRNLPVLAFDSLVSEKETRELYEKNEREYLRENPHDSYNPFLEPYFRNPEFETLLRDYFPERFSYSKINFNQTYQPLKKNNSSTNQLYEEAAYPDVAAVDSVAIGIDSASYASPVNASEKPQTYFNLASLYNYSVLAFNNPKDSTLNHQFYDEQWIALLQKNDRKAIENLLNSYTDLLKKQEIGYQFKHKNWIDYLPQYPYYFIDSNLNYKEINYKKQDYINQSSLNRVYENIELAKYSSTWLELIQYYLLIALIITVLIITFRFSSFKVWLISLIGAGILAILGSVFGISINASIGYTQFTPYIILFVFYIVFIAITLIGLRSKKYKILTGVNLNWFVATNVFIGIVMLSFYTDLRAEMLYDSTSKISIYELRQTNKELLMLQEFAEIFLYINPILYLISFYFIINLYKKWQAMPEE
ncbi:hypothetical protein ACTS91_06795 [Empedobacter falsenii]|uniref:hypothetical protein n=1 Tax=Empedobacter TaxID=59734 RepID=UPI00244764AC|nr:MULTISPECIES: hypothetical protein [Empedobacter]MDH1883267.1 hypothetical protein [Empedobacter sp. GD03797]MDM1042979.1 hypothetical protein [Empedobacter brevis]MDM1136909.1 hypothetical protein [Empedobacter sp. R750]